MPNHCPICFSTRLKSILPRSNLEYSICLMCRHCVLISKNNNQSIEFETAQKNYFGSDSILLKSSDLSFDSEILKIRISALKKFIPPRSNVIEVGPGAGVIASWLNSIGHNVTVVEHSKVFAERILKKNNINVKFGEWDSIDICEQSFDAVCSFHVIEHTISPLDHVRKAYKITKSGGLALIATPNSASLQHLICPILSPNFDSAHRFVFSKKSIENLCRNVGWEVIWSETPEISSNWARVFSKIIRRIRKQDEEATAGQYAVGSSKFINSLIKLFSFATYPFRAVQSRLGLGNEIFIVLRKP